MSGRDRRARILHAPRRLRALVRADEIWLTVLAGFIGALAGLCVVVMTRVTLFAHEVFFAIGNGGRLSGLDWVPPERLLIVPPLGGLVLGLFGVLVARILPSRPIDPIEANALHGGRMSVRDSLIVATQTIISNSAGASIGLEAGFTQISSAFASWFGRVFRVRREDLRILVACGAGGAIGAAFGGPVTGAFYAFELVLGTYSLARLSPVAIAAVAAVGVQRLLGGVAPAVSVPLGDPLTLEAVAPVVVLAIGSALVAIGIMYCVTVTESWFRRLVKPAWLRPAVGGLMVGILALASPSVLSAGHSAMRVVFDGGLTIRWALALLLLKSVASCVSIGSGFRGGLFFASLYLGVLAGAIFGDGLQAIGIGGLSPASCALIGMNAMAVAVIGSPMTMIVLTLELTGDTRLTVAALLACVLSQLVTRRLFGYSFATWRFHLRGETIRSAVDVGWMRSLNVRRMMRGAPSLLPRDTTIARARAVFPLGSVPRVVLVAAESRYAGILTVSDLHAPGSSPDAPVSTLAHYEDVMLTPQMNVREAVTTFERAEADALAVVDDAERRRVVGMLSEQHTLRRYAEELDRTRRALAGEGAQDGPVQSAYVTPVQS
ncbi:chloride channel protein [Tanticharoenia sakaeratensis]|uniref:Chloride channel protein n=1 Tax=Tanticharoenia sakaeratensis NBRC 103193 TaxID=1231623 RepID=A0A0D6MGU0_9PROT|nr:chloride channel protein [Tanticharoenia sakaeratensis]GAN52827.1 chloride channel protein [Tanticharoenia sakaeratensis NBRC 103193]GBQ18456.1 chloride channel protein [Tanticharoenia sakaeratensis NBRC 103193]